MRLLFAASFIAALGTTPAAFAQENQCISFFHAKGGVKGRFDGSITAEAGKPCQFPIFANGPGRLSILKVLKQPTNGQMRPEGVSVLHFAPKKGFVGKDLAVVLLGNPRSKARIRFAIDVR